MPANTSPRFTLNGNAGSNASTAMAPTIKLASGDYTGAGTNNALVFTAGATGSRLVGLHFDAAGSNIQSVGRVYINNGSAHTTGSNNSLAGKIVLPGTTASDTSAEPSADFMFPGGYLDLPANWTIWVGVATAVSAGWVVTPICSGDF